MNIEARVDSISSQGFKRADLEVPYRGLSNELSLVTQSVDPVRLKNQDQVSPLIYRIRINQLGKIAGAIGFCSSVVAMLLTTVAVWVPEEKRRPLPKKSKRQIRAN